jgi:hypothetical protein
MPYFCCGLSICNCDNGRIGLLLLLPPLIKTHVVPVQYLGDVPLAPGEETSAEYAIFFPKQLPPRDFVLQVSLVYSAGGAYQQKMFYNETISIVEEPTLFDTQLIGLYLIGLATLAGIGEHHCRPWQLSRPYIAAVPKCSHSVCSSRAAKCCLCAAYFFAEFARGKGWIKKSKPAARPGENG